MDIKTVLQNKKFVQQYVTFEEISEILQSTGEDIEQIFKKYQLGNSDFMDLKRLMVEHGVTSKQIIDTGNSD